MAVDAAGEHALVGGADGIAGIYSLPDDKIVTVLKVGSGAITDAVWYGSQPIIATSSGTIKVFEDGNEVAAFKSHAGAVNALAMHPSGEILASVGTDKSFVFYDLLNKKTVTQVSTDSGLSPQLTMIVNLLTLVQVLLQLHSIQMVIFSLRAVPTRR